MFTGIITDIGELVAREGGRLTIRCSYAAQSIAIGASIACDGACLTATEVAPRGERLPLQGRRLQRDAEQDHARRLADGPAHQPRACAQGRRRAGRAHRGGAHRRRRPHRRHPTRRRFPALHRGDLARACPLHRAPRARWRSTASRSPSTRSTRHSFGINVIPHTLTHTTWSAKKPGDRVNLEVDVFARYVARAMELRR